MKTSKQLHAKHVLQRLACLSADSKCGFALRSAEPKIPQGLLSSENLGVAMIQIGLNRWILQP